ncbi:MAG TPA: hypothetical protein VLM76_05510, partial [Patescibacteria group bacterium]|nr:hypothetical protein [Patescibacteria group bacterium]
DELAALRRRLAAADEARREAGAAVAAAHARASSAAEALEAARLIAREARAAEELAGERREAARRALVEAEAARQVAVEAGAASRARLAALRARADTLRVRLAADEGRGIAPAARRAGGRAVADALDVEPALRPAVAAALGELGRSFVIPRAALARLEGERGVVVLGDVGADRARAPGVAEVEAARTSAARHGGGLLADGVRTDPTGVVRRLLARWAWAPSLADAVDLAGALAAGWRVVAREGGLAGADGVVALGAPEAPLERRAEVDAVALDLAAAEAETAAHAERMAAAEHGMADARSEVEAARRAEAEAMGRCRTGDEAERQADRIAESAAREAAWARARVSALEEEWEPLAGRLARLEAAPSVSTAEDGAAEEEATARDGSAAGAGVAGALAAWESRAAEISRRRDSLVAARVIREADRRAAEARRTRAEAAVQAAEERIARADREAVQLAGRQAQSESAAAARDARRAEAASREAAARAALDAVRAADAAGRERLRVAEQEVAAARDALRRAEEAHRSGEVQDLEARLGLDAVREQALVEFAGLGEVGLRALDPAAAANDIEDDGAALAAALAAAGARWAAGPAAEQPAGPGRLASLRRRFHELGAANPFAVEEHAALRARVDGLEAQRGDLLGAIERTQLLIGELDALIARQFRATFTALEMAFDRQFQQLFGGGYARLSLTEPHDLAQTGVEIVARPPGKKAQALAMLSGGERALTAVALLFAMLEVRPVPFCVLDEVDAALDEANVGRFVDALRGLAETIQFVVITHNRGTIEAADALYGVTAGDDAVSRIVSLRIEEAHSLAASARAGRAGGRAPSTLPAG